MKTTDEMEDSLKIYATSTWMHMAKDSEMLGGEGEAV